MASRGEKKAPVIQSMAGALLFSLWVSPQTEVWKVLHAVLHSWPLAQRELLKVSLNDIASAVRTALDDAALGVEVSFAAPSSGEALLMFATPTDPSDQDWTQANQIVCHVVGKLIGMDGLRSRELPCAASGM
jgi:hypothetical protein